MGDHNGVTDTHWLLKLAEVVTLLTYIHIHTYITLHSMDPKLAKMTVGCGISHTVTKTHMFWRCPV
jgi:hypothetical protein